MIPIVVGFVKTRIRLFAAGVLTAYLAPIYLTGIGSLLAGYMLRQGM